MTLASLARAIAYEGLYQILARQMLAQGVIMQREKFFQLAVPVVVDVDNLLKIWSDIKGMVPVNRFGQPLQRPTGFGQ